MMNDEKLIRIPLQFFGESEDDFDDDLGYEDDEDAEDYEDDEGGADPAGDDGDADASGEDGGTDGTEGAAGASDTDDADLIADLKALGFKGETLAELSASVKARREAKEKNAAAEERAAAQAAGKAHVKSGKPQRGASGAGLDGFTERDIAEVNACLRNPTRGEKGRARAALERAVRAIAK